MRLPCAGLWFEALNPAFQQQTGQNRGPREPHRQHSPRRNGAAGDTPRLTPVSPFIGIGSPTHPFYRCDPAHNLHLPAPTHSGPAPHDEAAPGLIARPLIPLAAASPQTRHPQPPFPYLSERLISPSLPFSSGRTRGAWGKLQPKPPQSQFHTGSHQRRSSLPV